VVLFKMKKELISFWGNGGGGGYDADYQAWLTQIIADGGTQPSASVKDAQNDLVVALKAASLWTRMKAGWFLHCGDTTTGRRNIKNPSTFRTTLVGGLTFSEGNGTKSNGTDGAINTTYAANQYAGIETDLTTAFYVSESSTASNGRVYGTRAEVSGAVILQFLPGVGGSSGQRSHYGGANTLFSSANHKALYVHTHDGTNDVTYRNGSKDADALTPTAPTIASPIALLATNGSGVGGFTAIQFYTLYLSYFFMFDRFNDTDESTLRGILSTYNTATGLP
jgi:hypothetical protein